ncbi:MAG: hypothetical protein DI585_04500 [Pseudomonas fluorescens]|nr:MAG: hypothetical protein DI585_04500 [Pseudomonas fluorescens]
MSIFQTAESISATAVINQVSSLLQQLEGQPDLSPSPTINGLFNRLVGLTETSIAEETTHTIIAQLKDDGILTRLHHICAHGEGKMEAYWAAKLASGEQDIEDTLAEFPYYAEYEALAAKEIELLTQHAAHPQRVLFVGSGPLPLSAYMMAKNFEVKVDMLDIESHAHTCAMRWVTHTPERRFLNCIHSDIRNVTNFANYDAIFLAALAGVSATEKQEILAHLAQHMHAGQALVVRSADGLRRILYQQLTEETLSDFTVHTTWKATGKVVNSVIIATKP